MFKFIDSLSSKKIVTLSLVVSSFLSIPILVIYALNPVETTQSSANVGVINSPDVFRHTNPVGTPVIFGVTPFWGKVDDEVVIWGENFGEYPLNSFVSVGEAKVTAYSSWSNNQIIFKIPRNSEPGKISLSIGGTLLNWDKALNVTSANTQTNLEYKGGRLLLSNYPQSAGKIFVWQTLNGQPEIFDIDKTLSIYEVPKSFDRVEWISVEESEGKSIPFLINPISFDN